jgi:pimeloyl-[acyl-carrier protein] methyl ester esterase
MTPLVLLHGWALNHKIFADLMVNLERDCIAPDLPGHGNAPDLPVWQAQDLAEHLLRELPATFDLLGWSISAQIALQIAAVAPERVKRLILIGATPKFIRADDWPHAVTSQTLATLRQQITLNTSRTIREFLALQVRGDSAATATLQRLQQALAEGGEGQPAALQAALDWLETTDQRPWLGNIHQQTLVVAGQYDRIVHPEASKSLANQLPNALYLEIPRCGHAPFISHPDEIQGLVQEFLR